MIFIEIKLFYLKCINSKPLFSVYCFLKLFLYFHKPYYKPLNTAYKNNYLKKKKNQKIRGAFGLFFYIYYIFIVSYFKDDFYVYIIKKSVFF